ncbi:MAG: hypothetical protein ACP5LF_01240 [Nitrososphaeria archaeon]|nr:hypothetical protein [Conexivisphaerales archaeon]
MKLKGTENQGTFIKIDKIADTSALAADNIIEIKNMADEYSSGVKPSQAFLISSLGSPNILKIQVFAPTLDIANFASESKNDNFFTVFVLSILNFLNNYLSLSEAV